MAMLLEGHRVTHVLWEDHHSASTRGTYIRLLVLRRDAERRKDALRWKGPHVARTIISLLSVPRVPGEPKRSAVEYRAHEWPWEPTGWKLWEESP